MAPIENAVLPPGSLVLVTGANGLIGSHVVDQLLEYGYRVRGAVRDKVKHAWMTTLFNDRYKAGEDGAVRFELVQVPDMLKDGAFDEAVRGVSGVVHVASPVAGTPKPAGVEGDDWMIDIAKQCALTALESAAKEASVKRFVLTSSDSAAMWPHPDKEPVEITSETYNRDMFDYVKTMPKDMPEMVQSLFRYSASKTQCALDVNAWIKKNTPSFVVKSVLPSWNFGKVISPEHQQFPSSVKILAAVFLNDPRVVPLAKAYLPQFFFVDVQDCARLHVAALVHPAVKDTEDRIFATAESCTWTDVLAELKKLYPAGEFADDKPAYPRNKSNFVEAARAEELLQKMGMKGWTSLEQSVKWTTEDVLKVVGKSGGVPAA